MSATMSELCFRVVIPSGARRAAAPCYGWADGRGTPLFLGHRVQQIAVDLQSGARPDRLHQHGQVLGWDTSWLHVRMDPDRALVVFPAQLIRALDGPWGP